MSTTHESHLVGLIGQGVLPSLTPALHEHEADHHGIRYLYRPLDLDIMSYEPADVDALVRAAAEFGYTAFNVTHPCKQLVMDSLDEASDDTQRLGAANTVLVRDGRLIGHNTDFPASPRRSPPDSPAWQLTASCNSAPVARVLP